MRHSNPSGNVYYDNEPELCKELEKYYFKLIFGPRWKPVEETTKEVWISPFHRIDYFGMRLQKRTYVEVKNWFVTKRDMQQIIYYRELLKNDILILICGGIDDNRRKKLEGNKIIIILVKDIKEIDPESVVHWM